VSVAFLFARIAEHNLGNRKSQRRSVIADDRGGITIFMVIVFGLLLVIGGMAVDYQRYELARADLQDALDRGALAAANENHIYDTSGTLTLSEQAYDLISDYMGSRNYRPESMTLSVTASMIPGGMMISAIANEPVDTIFLRLAGITRMNVEVSADATQAIPLIEIALVLDVSKSMSWNSTSAPGTKLAQLQIAAKQFVETILTDEAAGRVLISIIPFSQQVSMPRAMADVYNLDRHHNYSSCFDFHSVDFGTVAMPTNPSTAYTQGQHFIETGAGSWPRRYGCPISTNALTPFSDDVNALKAAIDALTPESFTATYFGTKWGAALLDPSSRPIVDAMIASGELSEEYAGWPHDWNQISVRKIAVVMSDGKNTKLHEIKDHVYDNYSPWYWNNNEPSWGQKTAVVDNDKTGEGDVLLKSICDQLKLGMNTTVYTIGFELASEPAAAAALEDCASSLSTHYLVEGVEISTAFQNIAGEIVNLKLIN
jgi:Flp pilus assembly protein TadG